jgi:hypothetical protein
MPFAEFNIWLIPILLLLPKLKKSKHYWGDTLSKLPSQQLLRDLLDYNADTGIFIWKKEMRTIGSCCGKVAGGTRPTGYWFIKVRGYPQLGAHRLAWIFVYGHIPDGMEVDHRDNNPANNAINNLRLATSSDQKKNKRVQSNNQSGLKGAYYHAVHKGKKWRSQIRVDRRCIFLGYFHTAEEAHIAYGRAALLYFGEFARVA